VALSYSESLEKRALEKQRYEVQRTLEAIDDRLMELEDKYVQVVFLLGPDSPEWAWDEGYRDKRYTYLDPTRSIKVGDIVRAGALNGMAQVVALGKGEIPSYKSVESLGSFFRWVDV
jgi:hypothetical protein